MASTPTGKPRSKKAKPQIHLRRRILEKEIESQEDKNEFSPPEEPSDSSGSTVVFEIERYSLRSSKSSAQRERSGNASLFYKSILTPSRLKKKRSKGEYMSIYRTPKIKSTKKDYKIVGDSKTPMVYKTLWKQQVQNILSRHWKICYFSTMMGFHYSKKNLKSAFIRTLKIRILDEYPSYHLTVTITPSSFLYQNVKKTDSLFIKVTSLSLSEETGDEELRIIYEAMLIRSKNKQSVSFPGTDWFPLMLFSGLDIVHNVVVRWLQASFGCYITPRGLNAASIVWLGAVWTHGKCSNSHHKEHKDRVVSFHYYAALVSDNPKYRNEKGLSLKLTLKASTVMQIWAKVMGQRSQRELNSEDVAKFHEMVECVLYYMTRIPKELLSLQAVQTACNTISKTGKVRITCQTSFHALLQHLVESFENICHFQNLDDANLAEETDLEVEV